MASPAPRPRTYTRPISTAPIEVATPEVALASMNQLPDTLPKPSAKITRGSKLTAQLKAIPKPSCSRRESALNCLPISSLSSHPSSTVLYLGYGSNLAAETFLGRRGIKPLSQINVVVPEIQLTFDLPGIPYSEPCFGNSRYRSSSDEPTDPPRPPYHKNAWKKGLVGVVYEVTQSDYAHIIATEGGGSGYHDVLVDCFALDDDASKEVPLEPSGESFKAHTLYAHRARPLREDPDYAQPSPRYLNLITTGAEEHDLPHEYRYFLENIKTYHVTNNKQRVGGFVFLAVWAPMFGLFFGGARLFLDKNGKYPAWFAKLAAALFTAVWASYDGFFRPLFGDGERTIGDEYSRDPPDEDPDEKTRLLALEREGSSVEDLV